MGACGPIRICSVFESATRRLIGKWSDEKHLRSGNVLRPLFTDYFIASPTPIVHRKVFAEIGGFDETLQRHEPEDWDMWLRIAARFNVAVVPEPLALYRMHEGSLTAREEAVRTFEGRASVARRAADREPARLGPLLSRVLAHHAGVAARQLARVGQSADARDMFLFVARQQPWRLDAYALALLTFAGVVPFTTLRAVRAAMSRLARGIH